METKEINIKEIVEIDVENIKKEMTGIKNVIYEFNSLTMELPFIDKVDQNVKKNMVEKMRVIYANASDLFEEARKMTFIYDRKEVEQYIKQLNVYLNVLNTLVYSINQYFMHLFKRFDPDDDWNNIYTYYLFIAEMIDSFTATHTTMIIRNLGEEYYS